MKITDKIPTCEEEHRNDKEEEEGESVHVCSCCVTLQMRRIYSQQLRKFHRSKCVLKSIKQ